ncbi:AMP-binding protein [Planktotalea sp.]|uniref:non-ribosomal peptide synthetase n=1 Tax=Planktotalea sp. TaxID=2029877 RepID=UPI003F6D4376
MSNDWSLSFNEVHRLRKQIQQAFCESVEKLPGRVVGCLRDDESALFALLCITEITDYMPINPNLSDAEILKIVQNSDADCAILSKDFVQEKSPVFQAMELLDWDAIVAKAWQFMKTKKVPLNEVKLENAGRLILHTSGSTGLPKRVPIQIEAINASAKSIATGHQLSLDDHALNALPTFHIGALVDVLLAPWTTKGAVSITDKRSPMQLAQEIIAKRPTWIQVVPTILRRMVEDLEPDVTADVRTSLRFIRSISAPVPPDLKNAAEALFGCPVVEMYGMTETAGQIATNEHDPKNTRVGSVGKPIGVDLAIFDGFGNPVETGKTGEVCVKGSSVFEGYEGMAKEAVFFDAWFRTGDLGTLDEEGYLYLRGRLKEMINVGGEKVSPHEVETAALTMPDILEAAAYALPHPTLGESVGLTIATRKPVQEEQVKAFLKTQLIDFKCPNAITVLDQLPRLANAKVDRVLLKREGMHALMARTGAHTAADEPMSPIAKTVSAQWINILKCRPPSGLDDFFDMGGDSLSATQLLLNLEIALKRDISPNELFENPTFSGLVEALSKTTQGNVQTEGRAVRFVRQNMAGWPGSAILPDGLIHGIGSLRPGAPLFWACQDSAEVQSISETIGRDRPLYFSGSLFKFPNRKIADFELLAQQLAMEIDTLQPKGALSLGGFCGGANVMLHTAERLRDMGRDIRVLLSLDYWPDRVAAFPTIHCMSRCPKNSARMRFPRFDLALDVVHPSGSQVIEIDSDHQFTAADLSPHVAQLIAAIDGVTQLPEPSMQRQGYWDFESRLKAPKAEISMLRAPRFFKKGSNGDVTVIVTNKSDQIWEKSKLSGLSLQIDLVNLDGHTRKSGAGYAFLDRSVGPNESIEVAFKLSFPNKRIPVWISCCLASQGLSQFQSKFSGAKRKLILPSL